MLSENLDIFTLREFSQLALVNGVEVSGIFDEYYEQSFDMASSIPTEGKKYCFKVQSSQLPNVDHGFPVELLDSSRLFEVIGIQSCPPDGKITDLILKNA